MTRINVIPVEQLSDVWLIAEYRELPRVLKGRISLLNTPKNYILGKGHSKWARLHGLYTCSRFESLKTEMLYRGFKVNFSDTLYKYLLPELENDYTPTLKDLQLNIDRLKERYSRNPSAHKWTRRQKPEYLKE